LNARIITPVFFPALLLFFSSCDILRDSPFEVSAWRPGGGYHADPPALSLSLEFSREPDRASVERHFSVTEDEGRLKGTFQWNGKTVYFVPAVPLETNRDYTLRLSTEARDETGLSMDAAFEGHFTTRSGRERPVLVSCYPAMNDPLVDPHDEVRLVFSQSVSIGMLYDAVSFSPSVGGIWRTEDRTAFFTPAEPWKEGRRYELRISESLAGDGGMNIGRDFLSVFTTGNDNEKPCLTGAYRIASDGGEERLEEHTTAAFTENTGWEKDDRLRLVFSEPVDLLTVQSCLGAEDAPGLVMETAPDMSGPLFNMEATFHFERRPVFESRFSFRLKAGVRDSAGNESAGEYVFGIYADGVNSKPPALVGIRLPMSPDAIQDSRPKSYHIDDLFANLPIDTNQYPVDTATATWIECYFETAPGVSVDPFALMELFSVDTSNNALVFSPHVVSNSDFSIADPETGWERYQRLEIRGNLTNKTNAGVVNIQITPGLRDTAGNSNEKHFRISLLK
jgi:hypothetical protein